MFSHVKSSPFLKINSNDWFLFLINGIAVHMPHKSSTAELSKPLSIGTIMYISHIFVGKKKNQVHKLAEANKECIHSK